MLFFYFIQIDISISSTISLFAGPFKRLGRTSIHKPNAPSGIKREQSAAKASGSITQTRPKSGMPAISWEPWCLYMSKTGCIVVDKGGEAVLLLLDFSAAFDTLDHTVLLQRLAKDYSITGTVLQWIESYLQDRTQRVIINGTCSAPPILSCGVPQGSVVGPLLFLLYTGSLAKIIASHQGVNYAMYADDTQIYLTMGAFITFPKSRITFQYP